MRTTQIAFLIWLLSTISAIGLPCPLVDGLNSPINFFHEHIETLYKQLSVTSKQDVIKLIYFNEHDVVHLHSYVVVFSRKMADSLDESYIGIASRPRDASLSKIGVPYGIVKYIESDRVDEIKSVLGIKNDDFSDFFCEDLKIEFAEFIKEKNMDSFTANWRYQIELQRQGNDLQTAVMTTTSDTKIDQSNLEDKSKKAFVIKAQVESTNPISDASSGQNILQTVNKLPPVIEQTPQVVGDKQTINSVTKEVILKQKEAVVLPVSNLVPPKIAEPKLNNHTPIVNISANQQQNSTAAIPSSSLPAASLSSEVKTEDKTKSTQSNVPTEQKGVIVNDKPVIKSQTQTSHSTASVSTVVKLTVSANSQKTEGSTGIVNKISVPVNTKAQDQNFLTPTNKIEAGNQVLGTESNRQIKTPKMTTESNTPSNLTPEQPPIAAQIEPPSQRENTTSTLQISIRDSKNQQPRSVEISNRSNRSRRHGSVHLPSPDIIQVSPQISTAKTEPSPPNNEQRTTTSNLQVNFKQHTNPMQSTNIWVNDEFTGQNLSLLANLPTYSDIENGFSAMPLNQPARQPARPQNSNNMFDISQTFSQHQHSFVQYGQNTSTGQSTASFKQKKENENLRLNLLQIQMQEEEGRRRTALALKAKEDQDLIQKLYVILAYKRRQEEPQQAAAVKVRPTELFLLNSLSKKNESFGGTRSGSSLTPESLAMSRNEFNAYLSLSVQELSNILAQKERQFDNGYSFSQPKQTVIKSQYTIPMAQSSFQNLQGFNGGGPLVNSPQFNQSKNSGKLIQGVIYS
jgi:hypothetical protein